MTDRIVQLTPLTIGQYHLGNEYDGGVVIEVEQTQMTVDFPDKPLVPQKNL